METLQEKTTKRDLAHASLICEAKQLFEAELKKSLKLTKVEAPLFLP